VTAAGAGKAGWTVPEYEEVHSAALTVDCLLEIVNDESLDERWRAWSARFLALEAEHLHTWDQNPQWIDFIQAVDHYRWKLHPFHGEDHPAEQPWRPSVWQSKS
jgi:hypothetical protein